MAFVLLKPLSDVLDMHCTAVDARAARNYTSFTCARGAVTPVSPSSKTLETKCCLSGRNAAAPQLLCDVQGTVLASTTCDCRAMLSGLVEGVGGQHQGRKWRGFTQTSYSWCWGIRDACGIAFHA